MVPLVSLCCQKTSASSQHDVLQRDCNNESRIDRDSSKHQQTRAPDDVGLSKFYYVLPLPSLLVKERSRQGGRELIEESKHQELALLPGH